MPIADLHTFFKKSKNRYNSVPNHAQQHVKTNQASTLCAHTDKTVRLANFAVYSRL